MSIDEQSLTRGKTPSRISHLSPMIPRQADMPATELMQAFELMLRARLIDDKVIILYKQNKCHFQIGGPGHEAVQVAAAHYLKPGKDWFYPYYRDMALCVALGADTRSFFLNAMNKEADPNSHGRQMPMHYGNKDLRILNQSSPTGMQFPQAAGCALGLKQLGITDEIVYVSGGEGSCCQGDFHEGLNWASVHRLPVLFLVQNNRFAISSHVSEQVSGESVYAMTAGYAHLARFHVDGTDYLASRQAMQEATEHCRSGAGPALVEADVVRLQSHSLSDNHLKYRSPEDLEHEQEYDPIERMRDYLLMHRIATEEELQQVELRVKQEIDEKCDEAEAFPDCSPDDVMKYTWVEPEPMLECQESEAGGAEVTIVDAVNHTLNSEMARDPNIVVYGEDVAHGKGGVFGLTAGLTEKYGARVFNSPLAESSIVGTAIGMASVGIRPVVEIQFGDYIWTAMMQIRDELAMMHYRSGGEFSTPMVIRVAVGGYIHGGCYHSQNIEATFAHFPGIYIIYPSNATDAAGLLRSAIRASNPVLFLEHKGLYRQPAAKGPEGDEHFCLPIGKAKVLREGSDATILCWGALVGKSLLAARKMEDEGKSIEVIDLRSIVPFDKETVFGSVRKTGRLLIAHEDSRFMGFGAEIAAQVSELCFEYLDAPVRRVAMKDAAAVAHSKVLEAAVLPQDEDVLNALRELLEF